MHYTSGMLSRRAASRALAVAVVVVTGVGCSDSDSDSSSGDEERTEQSLARWQEKTTAVCNEFEPQLDEIDARFEQPENVEEIIAYFDAATPVNDRYIDALLAVPVPTTETDDVERNYELLELQRSALAEARAAAASDDPNAYVAAVTAISEQLTELNALADTLGVPACNPD